jgi:putative addiction module component (TIGR02574 family)
MTQAVNNILGAALTLSPQERAELATRLIESLDGPRPTPDEQAEIDAAWDAEIARRLKEIDDGTAELIDGEEFLAKLRSRSGRSAQT